MTDEIYILDIIGTWAFAVYGSYFALRKDFDIFGIFVSAFLTAVGGGTIREIILGNIPFYFYDNTYLIAIVCAIIFTIFIYRRFHTISKFVLFLDSIGLVTFAFIGAAAAHSLELGTFGIVFLATLTAVGGGVLRDIVLDTVPTIMHSDLYATIAILLGLTYSIFANQMDNIFWALALITTYLALRTTAIQYKITLWKPHAKN